MKEFLHLTQLRDRSSRWLAWTAVLAVSLGSVWLWQHQGGSVEPEGRSTPGGRGQVAAASMTGPAAAPLFPPATSALAAVRHQAQPYQTLRQLDLSGPPSPLSASLTTGVSAKPNVHGGGLRFEPNVGQTDRRVQYLVRGRAGAVFLCGRETVLAVGSRSEGAQAVLISSLIGSGTIQLQGEAPTGEQVAYLTGNRPEQWKTGVETVSRVRAGNVYPGIDAVWYGREGELEYDLELAPGAAPERIGLRFTGAESVRLDREGALVFRLGAGEVRQTRPVAWQEQNGVREPVAVRYEMTGPETVAFRLGAYDRSRRLVIDPVISYSSFAGGLGADRGYAVAVDGAGAAYLTGMTRSADFPGATGTAGGSLDAFVCKLNPDGSGPVWSLYLGGSGADQGAAIAVDGGGVVVAGTSDSPNFPLVTPLQGTPGGGLDAFVVKVKPDGSGLLWGTLLGGRQMDQANGVALAPNGDVVVTGATDSADFPTLQAAQATFGGRRDAFLTRLAGDGNALLNSTYLGGSGIDLGYGVAVDADGTAVVAGNTTSPNFPTLQAVQATYGGGSGFFGDGFVTTVTPAGTLGFSSYFGGADQDTAYGVSVRNGTATVAGMTRSLDFPVRAGRRGKTAGGADAFVLTLKPGAASGSQVVATAFLGGSQDEEARAVTLDATGRAVVAGWTVSPDFPLVRPVQTTAGGNQNKNAFVARLAPDGQTLVESTYLGGGNHDRAYGVAVDGNGAVYVTGNTQSGDFPVKNAFQGTLRGPEDGFVVKLSGCSLPVTPALLPVVTANIAYEQSLTVTGGTAPYTLQFLNGTLPAGIFFDSFNRRLSGTTNVAGGTFSFTVRMTDAAGCVDEQSFTLVVGNCPAYQLGPQSLNQGTVGTAFSQQITALGGTAPHQFAVIGGSLPPGLTLAADGTLSGTPTYASGNGFGYQFTVQATDQQGCSGSKEFTMYIACPADTPPLTLTPDSLPDGIAGQNYGPLTLTGSGGSGGPYTFALEGGLYGDSYVPPPAGLTLSAGGVLSGVPREVGRFPLRITVIDRQGCRQTVEYGLHLLCDTLTLGPATIPPGSLGSPYQVDFTVQGGLAPYNYSLSGNLPAGLSLTPDGHLQGTPTQGGVFNFSVGATDAALPNYFDNDGFCSVGQSYTLVIACTGYSIAPASLPGGSYNDPYDQTLTLTNGVEPVTWQVIAGTLPNGLTLGYFGGQLAGTPYETGNFTFTVQATDANGCQASQSYSLQIGGCAPMYLYSPPEGQVGVAYNQPLTATGGAAPYSYSLTGGALPAGLTLAPDGRLSGTPTTSQTATFTVRVTDANACAQSFDLTVNIVKVVNTSFGLQVLATNYDPTPSAEFVGDFTIQTRLTNTGTNTVNGPLFFQITALQSIPPGYLNRLKSADNASGTVGDRQTVTYNPMAPNETADVSFLIGVAGERVPFQFFVDLYGVLEGTSPRSLGRFSFTLTAKGLVGPKGIPVAPPVAAAEETPDKLLIGGRGAQTNPVLAVDPQNPLRMAVACDNGADGYQNKTVTVQVTVDGGKTWRAVTVAKRITQGTTETVFDTASGATLGYGPEGNLYLAYVLANAYNGENALALTRLTDRLTFEAPQLLTRLTAAERAYDCRPQLARRGTEWFLVWERVAARTNERQLWLAPVFGAKGPGTPQLVTKGYVTHPTLALGLDGSLTVGWHSWEPGKATSGGRIQCRTSRDGETWDDIVAVSPSNLGYGRTLPAMPEEEVTPDFKLVADPLVKGRLTGIFTVYGRRSDLLVVRSEDSGRTWSQPQPLMADPAGAEQFLPWLGVDAKGTVWVTWYDTRQSPTQEKVDLYQSRSSDGGKSFSEPERVTSGSSDDSRANPKRDRTMNLGNRLGGGFVNGVPVLVWTDTRGGDEDIYWLKK